MVGREPKRLKEAVEERKVSRLKLNSFWELVFV